MMSKLCYRCGTLPRDPKGSRNRDGTRRPHSYCKLCRAELKRQYAQAKRERSISLATIQAEQRAWQEYNFGNKRGASWHCLLGLQEELGEIAHAYLKRDQGIRSQNYAEKIRDGVGDLLIFLLGFANYEGIDLSLCLKETWAEVRSRDWKKFPKNGHTE